MNYIRVLGWNKYQHYKDRNPPWIKLHRELITSQMWVTCDDASRVLAVAIMLLAAATDNKIPSDPAYLKRVAYLNKPPNLLPLLACQFIELIDGASNVLADASGLHTNACSETEQSRAETEGKPAALSLYSPEFDEFWEIYPRKVGKGEAFSAWKKLNPSAILRGTIKASILIAIGSIDWTKDNGKYIPNPSTWLNQKRWDDTPTTPRPAERKLVL